MDWHKCPIRLQLGFKDDDQVIFPVNMKFITYDINYRGRPKKCDRAGRKMIKFKPACRTLLPLVIQVDGNMVY